VYQTERSKAASKFLKKSPKFARFMEQHDAYTSRYPIPFFQISDQVGLASRRIRGRTVTDFSSYNYLSLSGDQRLCRAAAKAAKRFGTSAGASRLVSGNCAVHRDLETRLSDLLRTEAALTFVGGHATNVSVIGHFMDESDLIVMDMLSHNSIIEGAKLSGAKVVMFRHNDMVSLRAMLSRYASQYDRVLIVVEGVYSMEGDIADLPRIVELKQEFGVGLMVDEAHSIGTLGETGGGAREHFDLDASSVDVWMGTLSKSFGSCGGYIAGSSEMINFLRYTCPGFVYSVGLPPPVTAAASMAIDIMHEEAERLVELRARADHFRALAIGAGLDIGASWGTPIVPVMLYSDECALLATKALQEGGINVFPIVYPAVKKRQARLRFFLNASHTNAQIERTIDLLGDVKTALEREGALSGEVGASGGKSPPVVM